MKIDVLDVELSFDNTNFDILFNDFEVDLSFNDIDFDFNIEIPSDILFNSEWTERKQVKQWANKEKIQVVARVKHEIFTFICWNLLTIFPI